MEPITTEQPIVEITEHTDYGAYRKFFYFARMHMPLVWVYWAMCYLAMPAIILMIVNDSLSSGETPYGLVLIIPLWLICVIFVLSTPRRSFNKTQARNPTVTNTAFFEDRFAYAETGQGTVRNGSIGYDQVARVYENKDAFYLKYNTANNWGF